jgi:hypothetical protein
VGLTLLRRLPAATPDPTQLTPAVQGLLTSLAQDPQAEPAEVALPDGRRGLLTPTPNGVVQSWWWEEAHLVHPVLGPEPQ